MSEVSKVVFAAFTQHCIQGNVTHIGDVKGAKYFTEQKIKKALLEVSKVYCTLYTEASYPYKRKGYLKSLLSCRFSSPTRVNLRRQLCYLS